MTDDDDEVTIPRLDMTKPVGTSEEMHNLRAAFNRVNDFPEFNPKERALWLELRRAVEKVLERWG